MKQELIEQTNSPQTVKKGGFTKKSLLFIGLGVLLLGGLGIGLAEAMEDYWDDRHEQSYQTLTSSPSVNKESQQSSAQVTSSSQNATTNAASSSELDGTYTATVYDETYILTVKGNQGTLQTNEADGEQEVEQIVFDLDNKVAYIDEDAETYTFDGKTLVLTEVDNDLFDKEQLTFTKQ